jgi:hypothetical protein
MAQAMHLLRGVRVRQMTWRRALGSFRGRRVRLLAIAAGFAALAFLWWPAERTGYTITLSATISDGRLVELFVNDFQAPPLWASIAPGRPATYEFGPWPREITRLRLDPTASRDAQVSVESLEILKDRDVVARFGPDDLARWQCDGLTPSPSGDGVRRTTTDDPVCVSPALSLPHPGHGTTGLAFWQDNPWCRAVVSALLVIAALMLVGHAAALLADNGRTVADPASSQAATARRFTREAVVVLIYASLAALVTLHLGQDMNYDLRNYHFHNPHALLNGRLALDVHAAGLQTFQNPLLDLPFYLAVHVWTLPPIAIGLALGAFHGLSLWLLHRIVGLLLVGWPTALGAVLGSAAAVTAVSGSTFQGELGTTFGDNTFAVLVLGALVALLASITRSGAAADRLVQASGLFAGAAAGGKLVASCYVVGLAAACLAAGGTARDRARRLARFGVFAALGLLLTGGYWMWLMVDRFGSPLFPYFNTIFKSPFAAVDGAVSMRAWYAPQGLTRTLFLPFFYTGRETFAGMPALRDFRLAAGYVAVVVLAIVALVRHQPRGWARETTTIGRTRLSVLAVFATGSYVVWLTLFPVHRFTVALEIAAVALVIGTVAAFVRRVGALLLVVVPICAALLGSTTRADWGRIPWSPTYFGVDAGGLARYEGATILMFGEPNGYLVPSFPASATFLRPGRGEGGPAPETMMFERLRTTLRHAAGPLYSLENGAWTPGRAAMLDTLGVSRDPARCEVIRSHMDPSRICALARR